MLSRIVDEIRLQMSVYYNMFMIIKSKLRKLYPIIISLRGVNVATMQASQGSAIPWGDLEDVLRHLRYVEERQISGPNIGYSSAIDEGLLVSLMDQLTGLEQKVSTL